MPKIIFGVVQKEKQVFGFDVFFDKNLTLALFVHSKKCKLSSHTITQKI